MVISLKYKFTLNAEFFAQLSIVLYFSSSLIRTFFAGVGLSDNLSDLIAVLCIYTPLILACLKKPRRYIKYDFIILYFAILIFFLLTYLIHPEYAYYYMREDYGLWDHVLIPYRGIYAYLFIRLLDDPAKVKKCIKNAGYIMLVYFLYKYYRASVLGYWTTISMYTSTSTQGSYSVSFGYEILPFAILFLYCAMKEKLTRDWIVAGLLILLIVVGGSRGPFLFIGIFLVLYFLRELSNSKHRVIIISGTIAMTLFIYATYNYFLSLVSSLMTSVGLSSRFLNSLLTESVTSDSGRLVIWNAAVEMIKENPFGYGAMGSRYVISKYIFVGYPHSVVLEVLIDFGVIIGGAILIVMLYNTIKILFFEKESGWYPLFLVYFCSACSLFISLTYWSVPTIWICFAIAVNNWLEKKRLKAIK